MLPVKLNRSTATLVLACSLIGCASLPPGSTRDPREHIERSTARRSGSIPPSIMRSCGLWRVATSG